MTPLPPSLYIGDVGHRRHRPVGHALRYGMLSVLADIDGPKRDATGISGFAFDRFAIVSQHVRDHGRGHGSLRGWVHDTLADNGIDRPLGRIQLLASPRIFGIVFNPLSVIFCHAPDDSLSAVLFEVSNFHGGRCTYAFPVDPGAEMPLRFSCDKTFYVSPFNPVEGSYSFRLDRQKNRYRLGIRLIRDGDCVMGATHTARRQDLTGAALFHAHQARPLNTLGTIGAILLEALKLRLKGLKTFAPRRGSIDTQPRGI